MDSVIADAITASSDNATAMPTICGVFNPFVPLLAKLLICFHPLVGAMRLAFLQTTLSLIKSTYYSYSITITTTMPHKETKSRRERESHDASTSPSPCTLSDENVNDKSRFQ